MASLNGICTQACKDKRVCWHVECKVIRVFTSGKFLVENRAGYVIAAVPAHLEFTEAEQENFKDYDLYATEEDLASIVGYQLFMQGNHNNHNNHRSKAYH
jgi:hypothetical protein